MRMKQRVCGGHVRCRSVPDAAVTPGHNVLVVTTVEDADVLRSHVGPDDTVKVVVPVVWQGVLDWLASDERAISEAAAVAERTAEQLPGETAEAIAGARMWRWRSVTPSPRSPQTRSWSRCGPTSRRD